ncbi:hypothetical protein OCK74_08820 [Chitinophagaceae bacterium LB-8]|uniref:ASCH domain-containing protein n=1 Tax=Paraflavisolibacter caeni TaxID=2982496 RepID=A0A9X3B857_9BACT|nr:hypothetical protein [Paraflavisolibacter caeni]MCU7549216.1 hypothetical protein [Paraflavisolibacter caeni]
MKVLLSIKPEFANKIFSGEKKYEFRRTIFKNKEVKKVIVYASAPIKKVIGEFEIDHILNDDIAVLWQQTKVHAGITEDFFFKYFSKKSTGYAIKVKYAKRYKKPLCIRKDFNSFPPQSFIYI